MSNTADRAYGLTILSPILAGVTAEGEPHDLAIRRELLALDARAESPLADVPTTHLARWVVIDTLPYEGIPARLDQLRHNYLLFTSNFDGPLGPYLELLRARIPETVERLWGHCVGFPGVRDAAAFATYLQRCQIETSFFFGAYTRYTVDDVLRALETQRRMAAFVAEQQTARPSPAALQERFLGLVGALRAAPTPRPGLS
jgi:hypothetical protein